MQNHRAKIYFITENTPIDINKFSRLLDVVVIIGLILAVAVYSLVTIDFKMQPFEDAAILMRYVENFAGGHGIVWNIGEQPVDGATDFLFMVFAAALVKLGLSAAEAVRFLVIFAHFLTVVIIYIANRRFYDAPIWAAGLSALYLGIGPGLLLIAAYFGTPVFGLLAALTWCCALYLVLRRVTHIWALAFALFGLVMGLIRPEGVILASLMLLAILYRLGWKRGRLVFFYFVLIFTVLGSLYFVWRWSYFGYPLPNPFYKKGGGQLYWSSLIASTINVFRFSLPFLITFVLALRSRETIRDAIFAAIPIVGFMAAFILLSEEMNYVGRFQYAVLPILLLSWYPLVKTVPQDFHLTDLRDLSWAHHVTAVLFGGFIFLAILGYQFSQRNIIRFTLDGRYDVATMLSEYQAKGYTLATTEAGLLPLYSGWRTIDAWGLNDKWIAHNNGRITAEYLAQNNPEIIMFHAYYSPIAALTGPNKNLEGDDWVDMTLTMQAYAEANDYVLAAAYGVIPFHAHYYYIRPDFPESVEIIERIRSMDYYWVMDVDGRTAIDFSRAQ